VIGVTDLNQFRNRSTQTFFGASVGAPLGLKFQFQRAFVVVIEPDGCEEVGADSDL
jgi:hypothetical protein